MTEQDTRRGDEELIEIDLRDPWVAVLLAWIWPGAGHLYQRRYAKGVLYMVCILGTFFFGLSLGGGHVVYASWRKDDLRLPYICQVGVGLPALPAVAQSYLAANGKEPLLGSRIMAPPRLPAHRNDVDELSKWHATYHAMFEMGTLYTMIAGLLNILAMYDALAGPVVVAVGEQGDRPPPDGKGRRKSSDEPND